MTWINERFISIRSWALAAIFLSLYFLIGVVLASRQIRKAHAVRKRAAIAHIVAWYTRMLGGKRHSSDSALKRDIVELMLYRNFS